MKTLKLNCFEDASRMIRKHLKALLATNFVIFSMRDISIAGRSLTFFLDGMRGMLNWLLNQMRLLISSLLAKRRMYHKTILETEHCGHYNKGSKMNNSCIDGVFRHYRQL